MARHLMHVKSRSWRVTRWIGVVGALTFGLQGAALAADPGIGNGVILLGQSAAMTGPASSLGIDMREGALAYFSRINAAGGVNGRKIELRSLDDGYEPERAAANTHKLIEEEKVFMLFGYVGTPTSQASLPIFTAAKVPFFGAFTGAELLRTPVNHYIFNLRASYYDETEAMVNHLVTSGKKNIAVFYQNDSYGAAGLKGVELAMKRRNLAISATGTVERNTAEVANAVKSISAAKPDAVVMVSAYRSCGEFVRQAKKAGMNVDFLNVSFVGAKALATDLGGDGYGVVIAQVVPFPWSANRPVVRDYHKAMASAYPQSALSFTSLEGYLAAKTLTEALRRVGHDLSRERLIAELERMREYDLGGFIVGFSPTNHNGSKFVDLTMIGKEGRFVR